MPSPDSGHPPVLRAVNAPLRASLGFPSPSSPENNALKGRQRRFLQDQFHLGRNGESGPLSRAGADGARPHRGQPAPPQSRASSPSSRLRSEPAAQWQERRKRAAGPPATSSEHLSPGPCQAQTSELRVLPGLCFRQFSEKAGFSQREGPLKTTGAEKDIQIPVR